MHNEYAETDLGFRRLPDRIQTNAINRKFVGVRIGLQVVVVHVDCIYFKVVVMSGYKEDRGMLTCFEWQTHVLAISGGMLMCTIRDIMQKKEFNDGDFRILALMFFKMYFEITEFKYLINYANTQSHQANNLDNDQRYEPFFNRHGIAFRTKIEHHPL